LSWVGRVLRDRYRLMEVVGRGASSLVYRAVERGTGEEVSVKVLHAGIPRWEEFDQRMEREHSALVALAGTAAPAVYEFFREPGGTCLVMEHLRGQDLDDFLRDVEAQGERVEVPQLIELLEPIVQTLEVAHERGLVHRDLKPGNVFVLGRGGPGGVRLLDFGLSRASDSRPITEDGMVLGSPSYIAPEVWEGAGAGVDPRVDVYALGAIVFRCLGGQVPFPVESLREKLAAARSAPRPSLCALRPELPAGIDDWVAQALAVRPDQRFGRVPAMWNALLDTLGASG